MLFSKLFKKMMTKESSDDVQKLRESNRFLIEMLEESKSNLDRLENELDEFRSLFDIVSPLNQFRFKVGDQAEKIGGSYQATGTIRSVFKTRNGENRVVFDFSQPPGMLHIFNEKQLEKLED